MRPSEEAEYTEYVTRRGHALRRFAYLLCADWHRAEDIVQTAITKLYVHWGRASKAEHLDAYVRQILVRTYLDEQRLRWAKVRRVAAVPDRPDDSAPDPHDRLVLVSALARIPARQRAVIVLRFFSDFDVEQTAAALNCSPGTVKSQTSHGLAALRKLLPDLAPGHPRTEYVR